MFPAGAAGAIPGYSRVEYREGAGEEAERREGTPGRGGKGVEAGKAGWLAGRREPSIADFVWGPVLDSINNGWTGDANALTAFPSLRTFHARFKEIPSVKAYYA